MIEFYAVIVVVNHKYSTSQCERALSYRPTTEVEDRIAIV